MSEKTAKTKRCCGPNGCGTVINPMFSRKAPKELLLDLAKEVNSPRWCVGSECMGWVEIKTDTNYEFQAVDNETVSCNSGPAVISGYCGLIKK